MKTTFNEFLNEVHVISNDYFGDVEFEFSIDINGITNDELNNFIRSLEKYFDYGDCQRIARHIMKYNQYKFWTLYLCWSSYGNASWRRSSVKFDISSNPYEYNFSISDFLELGLEGIRDRIEDERIAKRYNL